MTDSEGNHDEVQPYGGHFAYPNRFHWEFLVVFAPLVVLTVVTVVAAPTSGDSFGCMTHHEVTAPEMVGATLSSIDASALQTQPRRKKRWNIPTMFPIEFRVGVLQRPRPREDRASLVRRGSACVESWRRSGQNDHPRSTAGGRASSSREVDAPRCSKWIT